MEKDKVLKAAIDLLQNLNESEIDNISIDVNNYDDGTSDLSVSVTFPSKGDTPER